MKIKTIILTLQSCLFTICCAHAQSCYKMANYNCENAGLYQFYECPGSGYTLYEQTSGATSYSAVPTVSGESGLDSRSNALAVCNYTVSTNSCPAPNTYVYEKTVYVTNIVLVAYGGNCPLLAKRTDSFLLAQAGTSPLRSQSDLKVFKLASDAVRSEQ